MVEILTGWLVFVVLIGGLGLPVVAGAALRPDERVCLGAVAGCTILYLAAWLVYWSGWPPDVFLVLPGVAVVLVILRRRPMGLLLREPAVRRLLGLWAMVAGWCLGLLALVRSYSGGEWASDWLEHYQRTRFFLEHGPLTTRFITMYLLPARPPLANLTLGACLALTGRSFAYFQVFNALFSTLAFIPAALLAGRFRRPGGGDPAGWLALLLMLSPLFIENVTFSWTKLPAAFFLLAGIGFFLGPEDRTGAGPSWREYGAILCLADALLTHYSAAPYLLALGAIWIWRRQPPRWPSARGMRQLLLPAAFGLALLATWFAWSLAHFGSATFSATSLASDSQGLTFLQHVGRRLVNFLNLVVPHPLRLAEYGHLAQDSVVGFWRDYFFNLYQTNLFFAFGNGGMVVLLVLAYRHRRGIPAFWGPFTATVLVLHAAVISWPDRWGSVHIDLQPLVLTGLAWIAAALPELGKRLKTWLIGGLAVDAALGIALHFHLQHADLASVYSDYRDVSEAHLRGYATWVNFYSKTAQHLSFVGDRDIPVIPLCVVLALLLALAIHQVLPPPPLARSHVRS